MPDALVKELNGTLMDVRGKVDPYAAHLRPLDRQRLRGVGIKKQGFVDRAYSHAVKSPQFLPSYLPVDKFRQDLKYFADIRGFFDLCKQLYEYACNLDMQASDTVYSDALEFYAAAREAARRRRDGAETIHRDLEPFFRHPGAGGEQITEKKLKRDAKALLHGKLDGKIVIENVSAKTAGGKHRVIDERYNGNGRYKEAEEGDKTPAIPPDEYEIP
jgi:hypothetical protein